MEVPASLYALRVPGTKGPRSLNATELRLAGVVYSHAVISHERPMCTLTYPTIAAMLGLSGSIDKLRDASKVLEVAGFWRRGKVGGQHVWLVLVRPSDDGHRWLDMRTEANPPTPDLTYPESALGESALPQIRPTPNPPTPTLGESALLPGANPPPEVGLIRPPISGDQEISGIDQDLPPTPRPGFQLVAPPAAKARRGRTPRVTSGCTDEQWQQVVAAWDEARRLGSMSSAWGRWSDNATNRKLAARVWADGYGGEDLLAVMRHIGRGLAAGTHDPKWTSLEHVARTMGRYLHEAAGGPSRASPRGFMPEIVTRPADAPPAPPPTYYPIPDDEWSFG